MRDVTPEELDRLLKDEDLDEILIDVRTPGEYRGQHIEGSENVPLSTVEDAIDDFDDIGTVYVSCGSGARSEEACKILERHGVNVVNVEGGLGAWVAAGFETESTGKKTIPIIRQVMIVAGSLVLFGLLLGDFYSIYWHLLSAFVGAGLLFAGITGICTMSSILAKMPWNR